MSKPSEHKSVQARILDYAQKIGWKLVVRQDAEERRGFDPQGVSARDRADTASLYFLDSLHKKVQEFNPKFSENIDDLIRRFSALVEDMPFILASSKYS